MEEEANLHLGDVLLSMRAVDARGLLSVGIWARGLRAECEAVEHSCDGALGVFAHGGGVSAEEVAQEDGDEAEVVVCDITEGQRERGKGGREDGPWTQTMSPELTTSLTASAKRRLA